MAVVISDQLLDRSDRLLDAEPDEHLVDLAQTGHEAAFAAIVRRYEPELLAQARRLTSDGRAEDAVQQAFLNAFAALRADSEVRHLRGWLHRILRNVVTRARVPADAPLEVELAVSDSLEDTVQRRAQAHATLVELSALPERQRDALVGTAVHGLPRAHVAQAMGLSEGAVRQLVHRARRRLRQAATALLPLPLARLFGSARSSAGAAPDAAIGATTAVSGGLAIKVGTLLASGVVATGLAVTQTFPGHHHRAVATGARHDVAHPRGVTRHLTEAPLSAAAGVSAMSAVHRSSAPVHEPGTTGGAGRLHPTRSGRGRPDRTRGAGTRGGEAPGRSSGHGGDDSSSGSAGSGGTDGGRGGSGSTSGRSGSGSSGSGASGSGSGSGSGGGSGEDGGSSQSQGTSGRDGSGSGHDGPSSGNDGGGSGDGSAAGAVSAVASSAPASSTAAVDTTSDHGSGSSGGSGDAGASVDSGGSDASTGSGGSGGSQKDSGGSRDVSGSLDSSSS
jgi:RNA polymerase sigma factor (sigma-70 family)